MKHLIAAATLAASMTVQASSADDAIQQCGVEQMLFDTAIRARVLGLEQHEAVKLAIDHPKVARQAWRLMVQEVYSLSPRFLSDPQRSELLSVYLSVCLDDMTR